MKANLSPCLRLSGIGASACRMILPHRCCLLRESIQVLGELNSNGLVSTYSEKNVLVTGILGTGIVLASE